MKKIILLLYVFIPFIVCGQYLDKIEPNDLIGIKIKFLNDPDNVYGYRGFSKKSSDFYTYLDYNKYVGETGTIVSVVEKDLNAPPPHRKIIFEIKLDGKNKKVYFEFGDISDFPNNVGIIRKSLLII